MLFTDFSNLVLSLAVGKVSKIETSGYCFLGLSTTVPNADGSNFNEPSPGTYPSYKRVQVNINEAMKWTDKWGDVSGGYVENDRAFSTEECREGDGWPEFVFFAVFDSEEVGTGTPMMGDYLTDPDGEPDPDTGELPHKSLKIEYNHVATFREGSLRLRLK